MSDLNNMVFLYGHVGQDPDVRYNSNDTVVANFSLATSESRRDKRTKEWTDITTWHNITCWGELAKAIERKVSKSTALSLKGKLCNDNWQDTQGNKKTKTYVLLQSFIVHLRRESA